MAELIEALDGFFLILSFAFDGEDGSRRDGFDGYEGEDVEDGLEVAGLTAFSLKSNLAFVMVGFFDEFGAGTRGESAHIGDFNFVGCHELYFFHLYYKAD